jgi:hypothetical protein
MNFRVVRALVKQIANDFKTGSPLTVKINLKNSLKRDADLVKQSLCERINYG